MSVVRFPGRRSRRHRAAASLLAVAQYGHAQWLLGNLYEAVVKVPDLLASAPAGRSRSPLGDGSPLRYYAPALPATLPAVVASLVLARDAEASRRWLVASAGCSLLGLAATVYVVRAVNLRLFYGAERLSAAERERLLRTWYRLNAARIAVTGGAWFAAHRARSRLRS